MSLASAEMLDTARTARLLLTSPTVRGVQRLPIFTSCAVVIPSILRHTRASAACQGAGNACAEYIAFCCFQRSTKTKEWAGTYVLLAVSCAPRWGVQPRGLQALKDAKCVNAFVARRDLPY